MSIVTCPECKKEISDQAASCPNCGSPNTTLDKNKKAPESVPGSVIAIVAIFMTLFFLGKCGVLECNNSSDDESTTTQVPDTPPPSVNVELIRELSAAGQSYEAFKEYINSLEEGNRESILSGSLDFFLVNSIPADATQEISALWKPHIDTYNARRQAQREKAAARANSCKSICSCRNAVISRPCQGAPASYRDQCLVRMYQEPGINMMADRDCGALPDDCVCH